MERFRQSVWLLLEQTIKPKLSRFANVEKKKGFTDMVGLLDTNVYGLDFTVKNLLIQTPKWLKPYIKYV